MPKFVCENCNYKFESELESVSKKCPYCEKQSIIRQLDAQDLLNCE